MTPDTLGTQISELPFSRIHLLQWAAVGVATFVANGCVGSTMPFILLGIHTSLNFSPFVEGAILFIGPLGGCVGSLLSGSLADAFGRRRLLCMALLLLSLCQAALGAPRPSAPLLMLLLLGRYFFYAQPEGIAKTLLAECLPRSRRGLLLNLVHPIWQCGGILLAATAQWRTSAVAAANGTAPDNNNATAPEELTDTLLLLGRPTPYGTLAAISAVPALLASCLILLVALDSPLWLLHARSEAAAAVALGRLSGVAARARVEQQRTSSATELSAVKAAGEPPTAGAAAAAAIAVQEGDLRLQPPGGRGGGGCSPCPGFGWRWRQGRPGGVCGALCVSRRRAVTVPAIWFCLQFAYESNETFFIRFLRDTGRAALIQQVTLTQYVSKLVGGVAGSLAVDCVGRKRLLVLAFALGAAALVVIIVSSREGHLALLAAVSCYYAATEAVWSTLKTFTVELFTTTARATAIGAATAAGFVGSSATLFLGPVLMAYADARTPFQLNAGALVVAMALTCSLEERFAF